MEKYEEWVGRVGKAIVAEEAETRQSRPPTSGGWPAISGPIS
jgi:hypothetical protein